MSKPAQLVDREFIADLDAGDLLFIDFHACRQTRQRGELPDPRGAAAAASRRLVHFHDIYFPYDYARDTLSGDMLFPQESALLYAFLAGNPRYRVEAALSMVHYERTEALRALIPKYEPEWPGRRARHGDRQALPELGWLRTVAA